MSPVKHTKRTPTKLPHLRFFNFLSNYISLSLSRARKSNGIFAGCRDPRFSIEEINSIDGIVPNFGVVVINQSPQFSSPLACKCSFYFFLFVFLFLLSRFPFRGFWNVGRV